MIILKMAFRNIFRQKRRTILTGLSMCGGFVMAAVFIGWADGSYNTIIDNFTRNTYGQIQIHERGYLDHPSLYRTIDDPGKVEGKLKLVNAVESWAPRVYSAGLAAVGEKTTGVRIIGINPEREDATTGFSRKIVQGRNFSPQPSREAIVGRGLASILSAGLNEEIVLVTQAADGSLGNELYRIIGILDSGDENADRSAFYLHIRDAQDLLVLGTRIHEIAITVFKLQETRPATAAIRRVVADPALSVEPWQVFARSFYVAMKADMQGTWVSLFIIVLIVAVGVLNTVLMSVLERQREYGLLKAVGTRPGAIVRLVLAEVGILALFSIALGAAMGFGLNSFLTQHGLHLSNPLTWGGMRFEILKSEINARSFYIPCLTVFFSAVFVGFFPALKAARTDPAKSLRFY
jgi:putative ABC transport system permease protein